MIESMDACPHCGSTDHYLFEAGAMCIEHARQRGLFRCKKDASMAPSDIFPDRVFTAGCAYSAHGYDDYAGFFVIDDADDIHAIGAPGDIFFNQYFEVAN